MGYLPEGVTIARSVREQVKMFDLFSHATLHLTLYFQVMPRERLRHLL